MTQNPPRDERDFYERIYTLVEQVPWGKVATYGDIATLIGVEGIDARVVGHALGAMGARSATIPWQRIINRTGGISLTGHGQRERLEAEGVTFDEKGHAKMEVHHWSGPGEEWAREHGFKTLPRPADTPASAQLTLF